MNETDEEKIEIIKQAIAKQIDDVLGKPPTLNTILKDTGVLTFTMRSPLKLITCEGVIDFSECAKATKERKFFDLFEDNYDCPENMAERGVPEDTIFCYVSNTFLDGFINYVDVIKVVMVRRYDPDTDHSEVIKKFNRTGNSSFRELPDDVLLIAKSENDYWFFWFDGDVSDCCIGRFSKEIIDEDDFISLFDKMISTHESFKGEPYELQVSGWISY